MFRVYKDPTILKPQFHPIFTRLQFFESQEGEFGIEQLEKMAIELTEFIFTLEKGEFYGIKIEQTIIPQDLIVRNKTAPRFRNDEHKLQRAREYFQHLQDSKEQVYSRIVESLRYQPW